MKVACLIPVQKRLQVTEAEGTANRDRLCCISSPKLTIRVATNGSQDCKEG
jgi:hypothetical protein